MVLEIDSRIRDWQSMLSLPVNLGIVIEDISADLGEFDSHGGLVAFNPAGYMLQKTEAHNLGRRFDFDGLESDLEAVVAETLLESELRRISFDASVDKDGNLTWWAPGHESRGGDVLKMSDFTVNRYKERSVDFELSQEERDQAMAMVERFSLERRQTELIIDHLESSGENELVIAVLPDNDVVYPLTKVNYLTAYRLERNEDGEVLIGGYPLMNRYSNRVLSEIVGGENLSEQDLVLGVQTVDWSGSPEELFLQIDELVNDEERDDGLVGSIIDRTKEINDCSLVIKSGRSFLEEIINFEFLRLSNGEGWREVKDRLSVAWELVIKNIIGFLEGERYLSREELLGKVEEYIYQATGKFNRQVFLRRIVMENDLQILNKEVVAIGACGSLGLDGLSGVPFGASSAEWKLGSCVNPGCPHKGQEIFVGPCSICSDCEKVL